MLESRITYERARCVWSVAGVLLATAVTVRSTGAQAPAKPAGGCELPVAERQSEVGCYLVATTPIGALPDAPIAWHLDQYPTKAAAETAKGPRGTVVESFGKIWLFTIESPGWRAPGAGTHIATVGPLPIHAGHAYTARYMEAVFTPGMKGLSHTHSGPEAWYVVSGAQCLETPDRVLVARAGDSAVILQGPPMAIASVGSDTRRALLVVLHDSSAPWITTDHLWKPKGLCPP